MYAVTNTTDRPRKTKPKGRHPDKALSAAFVRTAPPGRHCDGNGLYLFVQPSGARSWVQRLVIRGRRRDFGLGSVALVSLAEACEKARANRKLAREGGDPLAEKRRARGMPSFVEAAAKVVEQKRTGWRNPKQAHDWMSSLARYAFPRIGEMAVSDVTSADVLGDPHSDLAREDGLSAKRPVEDPGGAGVGRGDGAQDGQPLRPARLGAKPPA